MISRSAVIILILLLFQVGMALAKVMSLPRGCFQALGSLSVETVESDVLALCVWRRVTSALKPLLQCTWIMSLHFIFIKMKCLAYIQYKHIKDLDNGLTHLHLVVVFNIFA